MRFVKLFCVVAFVAFTAVLGAFWQPRLAGRTVGDNEAGNLKGGGCYVLLNNQCGTAKGCTGTLPGIKLICTGTQNANGVTCIGKCSILKTPAKCTG
jgi:hypothetical protein